jgi:hypothetical protein
MPQPREVLTNVTWMRLGVYMVGTKPEIERNLRALHRAFLTAAHDANVNGFTFAMYDEQGNRSRVYIQGDTVYLGDPPKRIEIEEQ